MSIRALVVDDEPLARERIRELLRDEPDVDVIGECGDGEEAAERIVAMRPNLVFLDIQMPEMTGFDVLDAIRGEPMPVIVFVTAYDEYALRAFDAHALDYLMKPFHRERFASALQRARAQIAGRNGQQGADDRIEAILAEIRPRRKYLDRVAVRIGERILLVRTGDVDWIDADGNYARLHVGERGYLLRETMGRLAERLDPQRFLRIHRSTIVNLDRIREIQPLFNGNYVVILQNGAKLTSARSYRDGIQALISGVG